MDHIHYICRYLFLTSSTVRRQILRLLIQTLGPSIKQICLSLEGGLNIIFLSVNYNNIRHVGGYSFWNDPNEEFFIFNPLSVVDASTRHNRYAPYEPLTHGCIIRQKFINFHFIRITSSNVPFNFWPWPFNSFSQTIQLMLFSLCFGCMEKFFETSHHLRTFDASVHPWRDQSIPVVTLDCINDTEKVNRGAHWRYLKNHF